MTGARYRIGARDVMKSELHNCLQSRLEARCATSRFCPTRPLRCVGEVIFP